MKKSSKILTMGLALSFVLGSLGSVSAAEISASGDGGSVPVELTTEALTFSVTVPTALPVDVNASGEVTVATDAKIFNNSAGPVEVKSVKVEAVAPWVLVGDFADLSAEKVGTDKFSFKVQNANVAEDGACAAVFDVIPAKSDTEPGSIDLSYGAHVAPQNSEINATIANVVFTIGWEEVPTDEYGNPVGTVYTDFAVTAANRAKVGFTGKENENLVIPATFKDEEDGTWYKVTSIKHADSIYGGSFYNCSNLSSVIIPNSVTNIGNNAFPSCTSLTSITIPDGVKYIGQRAFNNCTSLTSITIPDSVTSIGPYAFADCANLTSIEIPDSVTSIGMLAFQNCTSLTSVTWNGNTTSPTEFETAWNTVHGTSGNLI